MASNFQKCKSYALVIAEYINTYDDFCVYKKSFIVIRCLSCLKINASTKQQHAKAKYMVANIT